MPIFKIKIIVFENFGWAPTLWIRACHQSTVPTTTLFDVLVKKKNYSLEKKFVLNAQKHLIPKC